MNAAEVYLAHLVLALVLGVSDTVCVDGEGGFALGQAGAVVDLADPVLPPTLPKLEIYYT